jgi:PAS domain S-box-containing protein
MMKSRRRVLILEDNPIDAFLLRNSLSTECFDCEVVEANNKTSFLTALATGGFDLIISDYLVPGFDGLEALALAREESPDIPFIFFSGAMGDGVAVETLRAGANDYVLKDRPARLVPAIQRTLAEADERARRKRLERQYEGLVNSIDGIVWRAELPSLQFTFVSPQAERFLGYPTRCWLDDPNFWQDHIHSEDRARAIRLCTGLTAEKKYQDFEYRMLAADGCLVWLRNLVSLGAEPGEAPHVSGIMLDITKRKQSEEKLRRIQAKLRQSNQELLAKNHEIQSFYHTLSHELKTPLTSAREFISIVMDGLAGPLSATQLEYLGIAKDSCDRLRACINDLIDATRLETGKLAIEVKPVAPGPLIQRVVASFGPAAAEKKIALTHEVEPGLPEVHLDENRIIQVFTNLLNNAIRFTPAGGRIEIRAAAGPTGPDFIHFAVRDAGCGIAKEEQNRIFDRLYQVKAGDAANEEGIGLGLYLCRELVQLHGGTIWVESEPGRGSTFAFALPRAQHLLRPNLLVIEDDPDLRQMLQDLLASDHYNVRTARDGAEGLEELRRQIPDIVLLDMKMPNLDGPSTLKEIRKHWGPIPVIVHAGFTDGELVKQALAFSPLTLLAKPCSPHQILETVRKVQQSEDTSVWRQHHIGLQKVRS